MSAVDCRLPSFHPFRATDLDYFPPLENCMENPSPIDSSGSTISTSPGAITPVFGLTLTVDPGLLEKSPKALSLPSDLGKRKRNMSPSVPNQQDYESRRRRTDHRPFEYRSLGSFDSAFAPRAQYMPHYDASTQLRQHSYPIYHPHSRTGSTNADSPSYRRDSSLQVPEVSSAPWLTSPVTSMASLDAVRMASKSPRIPEWSQTQSQHVPGLPQTTFSPAYSPLNSFAPHDAPHPVGYSYPPVGYTSTSREDGRKTHPVPSRDKSKSISSTSDQALPAVVAQITAHQRLQHQQAAQNPNTNTEEHSLPLRTTQQTNPPEQELTPGAQREKLTCWEHGCEGRVFSTFSNLLRHQREKAGTASKSSCPKCGAEFTRTTARNSHLLHAKCRPGERKDSQVG